MTKLFPFARNRDAWVLGAVTLSVLPVRANICTAGGSAAGASLRHPRRRDGHTRVESPSFWSIGTADVPQRTTQTAT